MITILGAGGAIGNELMKLLAAKNQPFRLVGRNPKTTPGATETLAADLTDKDQTIRAVAGSRVVHLLVGLKYDHKLWQEVWPRIMSNTIEACKRARAKLLFFDNVYMYGKVSGPMTEETPFNPCSKKGEIRAKIATTLINESKSGGLVAMIARSADFYGPDTRNGVPNLLVFEPFAKKQKASWLVNDSVPHSFTYTPDAAQSLVQLAERATAWNQTWHVPATPNPLTGREFVALAAKEFGVEPKYRVLSRPILRIAGWFDPLVAESYEMLYQSDSPYLFDSSKFAREFDFTGTRTLTASERRPPPSSEQAFCNGRTLSKVTRRSTSSSKRASARLVTPDRVLPSPGSNPATSAGPPYNPRQLALVPGTRLGVYEVTAPIGEGGTGQVFRARDTTLNRDVALKVLPDSFANDPDRLARFTREARTLASLNHPNIAHIHGLEESGGVRALVMELVEGDDLSQRIARGAISIDEALGLAKQIAEALEAAHEQNIIHRDLKPANIKVRPDGTVKVLDFGLSKATGPSSEASGDAPTMRSPAMTQAGMILGTAAYMSPEQARGKTVDKRADMWAFGCVLHEMLTGTRLFAADSVSETLGLIFSREPDLTTLPTATPARVRALIARCLVKDPRQRMRDIGEARLALDAANDTSGAVQSSPVAALWRWVAGGVAPAVALVAAWALWGQPRAATTAPQVTHLEIGYPRDVEPISSSNTAHAISPDDRQCQVSDGGGIQARWGRNTREIYYRSGRRMVAAALDASGTQPVFGKPVALFADDYDFGVATSNANYDVTADGRFIMIRRGVNGGKLRVVINWTDEVKQILASGGVQ